MHRDFGKRSSGSAVLLVGHGTRDADGLAEFERLAAAVAGRLSDRRVERAYLELVQPTIPEAFDRLAAGGATSIRVVPLLLFAAGHAKRDMPAAVEESASRHPRVRVEIAAALRHDEEILALSGRRFDEALTGRRGVSRDLTLLLMVARGTSDGEALDDVRRFAALRGEQSKVGRAEVCFVAAARPSLAEGLELAARAGYARVVVQPHLLFAGQVLDEIRAAVIVIEKQAKGVEWILTPHLGPEEELVRAVMRRAD